MSDNVGSIRKITIEGIPYRARADGDLSHIVGKFENSVIVTSGAGMMKQEKRSQDIEGVQLSVNGNEQEEIKAFAENQDWLKLAFTTAGGDTYRCNGKINIENRTSLDGTMSIKLMPQEDWTAFID